MLTDILFFCCFFIFPIVVEFTLRCVGYSLFRFSLPSFVLISILVFAYIGVLPLYFGLDSFRFESGVQDKHIILKMFFANSITLLLMVLGLCFGSAISNNKEMVMLTSRSLNKVEFSLLLILFIICCFVLLLYISKLPRIALLVALTESAAESKSVRSSMGNAFSGAYHWYSFFISDVLTLVLFTFFANYIKVKNALNRIIFYTAFFIASVAALIAAEKAPFIWLLIGLFLVHTVIIKDGNYGIGKLLFFSIIVTVILALFYVAFMGVGDVTVAVTSVFSRAFTGGITPAYYYFEYFPYYHEYLLGRSFPNPGGLLPFEPFKLTVEIMDWKHPGLASKGIVGTAPTVYWGEMYANFGWLGIIIPPFFVGFYLHILSILISKIENSPIKFGFLVWASMHYMHLSDTSLSGFIIDIMFAILLFIVFIVVLLGNDFKLRLLKRL